MMKRGDAAADVLELTEAKVHLCMKCGRCSASCPVSGGMDFLPHEFVAMLGGGNANALIECDAIWQCLSCFACAQRCPRDVKPVYAVDAVRQYVIRQKKHIAEKLVLRDLESMPQQLLVSLNRKFGKSEDGRNE